MIDVGGSFLIVMGGLAMMSSAPMSRIVQRKAEVVEIALLAVETPPLIVDMPDDFDLLEHGKTDLAQTYRDAAEI